MCNSENRSTVLSYITILEAIRSWKKVELKAMLLDYNKKANLDNLEQSNDNL